ncbi:MAG: Hsp70 family protein [Bacteroidota bacterium]
MIIAPVAVTVLLLIFILTWLGRPKDIRLDLFEYNDNYMSVNFQNQGKIVAPYKVWTEKSETITFRGSVKYSSPKSFLNWGRFTGMDVHFTLKNVRLPKGMDIYLEDREGREFREGTPMILYKYRPLRKIPFEIDITLNQHEAGFEVNEPVMVGFEVEVDIEAKRLFFLTQKLEKKIDYEFFIGQDLGISWIGIDPGTTGTCIVAGTSTEDIVIEQENGKDKITPSVIAFNTDPDTILQSVDMLRSGMDVFNGIGYRFGTYGKSAVSDSSFVSFQSIKKLLGYTDTMEVSFTDGRELSLDGKLLSSLLVNSVYKDFQAFVRSSKNKKLEIHRTDYKCHRAVVAIPNNFTATKIQDMIDCLKYTPDFIDVRYVHEAEATLFYYISNYHKFRPEKSKFEGETVLIYDMGGATINCSVVDARFEREKDQKYYIDVLAKLGYGIGGDTIDYALIKFFFSYKNEYPAFASLNPFEEIDEADEQKWQQVMRLRKQLMDIVLEVKKKMIANFSNVSSRKLIEDYELTDIFNQSELFRKRGLSIDINEGEDMFDQFVRGDIVGDYPVFRNEVFEKLIYENVRSATFDILQMIGDKKVDTVLFSGRSTLFPFVSQNVLRVLNEYNFNPKTIFLPPEDLKSAVAKGCCWYGLNHMGVERNALKTSAAFGFKQSNSGTRGDFDFYTLIQLGEQFNSDENAAKGEKNQVNSDFRFDAKHIEYFQVMGKKAEEILAMAQRHKFSRLSRIRVDQKVVKVGMKVNDNDVTYCFAEQVNGKVKDDKSLLKDQEIADDNDEHYTWIVH